MNALRILSAFVCIVCFIATLTADSFALKISEKWFHVLLFVGVGFVMFSAMAIVFVNAMKSLRHHQTVTRHELNAAFGRGIPFWVYLVGIAGLVCLNFVAQLWLIPEPILKGRLSDDGGRTFLTRLHDVVEIPRDVYERQLIGRFQEMALIGAYVSWLSTVYLTLAVKRPIFDDEFRFDDLFDAKTRR